MNSCSYVCGTDFLQLKIRVFRVVLAVKANRRNSVSI